jgi:hypothetical protein
MVDLCDVVTSLHVSQEHFKIADMMRTYKTVTEEEGPSQQLINFIAMGGSVGEEIGLESFEKFSTSTQHEIFMSKLDPDAVENMAMESFRDFIIKYRMWLLASLFIPIGPNLITFGMGVAGVIANRNDKKVIKYSDFYHTCQEFTNHLKSIQEMISKIPSSFKEEDWTKFKNAMDENNDVSNPSDKEDLVVFKNSGWTESNFEASIKWVTQNSEKLEAVGRALNGKLEVVDKYLSSNISEDKNAAVVRLISSSVNSGMANVRAAKKCLANAESTLNKVATHFEPKSKK